MSLVHDRAPTDGQVVDWPASSQQPLTPRLLSGKPPTHLIPPHNYFWAQQPNITHRVFRLSEKNKKSGSVKVETDPATLYPGWPGGGLLFVFCPLTLLHHHLLSSFTLEGSTASGDRKGICPFFSFFFSLLKFSFEFLSSFSFLPQLHDIGNRMRPAPIIQGICCFFLWITLQLNTICL